MDTLTLPDLDIVRTTLIPCTWRADENGESTEERDGDAAAATQREGLGLMDVKFSPFNSWYRIASFWEGDFMERTVPGAFKRTIAAHNAAVRTDAHNVKTLFNHGMDMYIDQKLLGDIDELAEDADSPRSTVWLWDTSYNRDLLPGLRSGAYGSSFMFRVLRDEWNNEPDKSDYNPDGLPERTIKEVRLFEAGPVTWPANPAATAGMRCASATDAYYDHLARRDPQRVDSLRSQLTALRDASRPVVIDTRPADGPAPEPPTDPASSHSGVSLLALRQQRIREAQLARL